MKTLFDLDEVYVNLEKVETTVGSNGYPSKLQWAYYCENRSEMEEIIEDLEYKGFEVEELFLSKKNGQQLWNRDRVPHRLVNLFHEDSQSYAIFIDTDSGEENIKLTIDSVLIGDDEEFREELGQDKIDEIVESFYKEIPLNKGVIKVFYDPEQDNRVDYIITEESTGYHDGDVTSYQMAFSVLQKEEEDEQD